MSFDKLVAHMFVLCCCMANSLSSGAAFSSWETIVWSKTYSVLPSSLYPDRVNRANLLNSSLSLAANVDFMETLPFFPESLSKTVRNMDKSFLTTPDVVFLLLSWHSFCCGFNLICSSALFIGCNETHIKREQSFSFMITTVTCWPPLPWTPLYYWSGHFRLLKAPLPPILGHGQVWSFWLELQERSDCWLLLRHLTPWCLTSSFQATSEHFFHAFEKSKEHHLVIRQLDWWLNSWFQVSAKLTSC